MHICNLFQNTDTIIIIIIPRLIITSFNESIINLFSSLIFINVVREKKFIWYVEKNILQNFSNIPWKLHCEENLIIKFLSSHCYLIWWLNSLWIFYNKINKFLSYILFSYKSRRTIEYRIIGRIMNIYLFEYFVLISKKICANKITYYYPNISSQEFWQMMIYKII